MTAADAITGTSAQPATAAAIVLLIFIEFLLQADACAGILVANALRLPDGRQPTITNG
jgi:hypothetical protein